MSKERYTPTPKPQPPSPQPSRPQPLQAPPPKHNPPPSPDRGDRGIGRPPAK